jgi:hypothetical protein
VPIESTTEAKEIELRQAFAEQFTARQSLLDALKRPLPLTAFGRAVREAGLQRQWHSFRTEKVVEKIQRWAKEQQIEWKDAWLTEGWTDHAKNSKASYSDEATHAEGDALQFLFSRLDAVDIQRISIPLDLVLKAISSSKKR